MRRGNEPENTGAKIGIRQGKAKVAQKNNSHEAKAEQYDQKDEGIEKFFWFGFQIVDLEIRRTNIVQE